MTNPKSRKTGAPESCAAHRNSNVVTRRTTEEVAGNECDVSAWMQQIELSSEETDTSAADSITPTPSLAADLEEMDEDDVDSSSSFSLQECINEFAARRIRRISTQSREAPQPQDDSKPVDAGLFIDPAEADLINQNRSNKEQERKCKPCQNGFCYCFTSDSGDGGAGGGRGGCGAARLSTRGGAAHVRQTRRSRKSESSQISNIAPQRVRTKSKEKRRQSAPANFKVPQKPKSPQFKAKATASSHSSKPQEQLTAISRLETSAKDAPLIHIIQELHNNCVISEVRVNKHKIQEQQRSRSLNVKLPKKTQFQLDLEQPIETSKHTKHSPTTKCLPNNHTQLKQHLSSAPTLDKISEFESMSEEFVYSSPLNTSAKSTDSARRKHKAAGRLLQKRLSHSHMQFKPRNLSQPPPKPPRSSVSFEDKSSISTLASTSPSVREAERVLDDFLRRKGVKVPGEPTKQQNTKDKLSRDTNKNEKAKDMNENPTKSATQSQREKRKSYPLTKTEHKSDSQKPLPSCPSLSDIERVVDSTAKQPSNYEKNIRQAAEKPVKELSFGWNEPKINEMLNYDTNANQQRKQFRSQAAQAEPQSIGWQIPPHKIDLDTVDSGMRHNLASNMDAKNTPVKTRLFSAHKCDSKRDSQRFIWGEQWRSLSPWTSKQNGNNNAGNNARNLKSNLKSSSRSFLSTSKKKILRLVSPKKENKERRNFEARKTPLRASIGVQTSREDVRLYELSSTPQSPPGSYHSAVQTSQQSSSLPTPTRSQSTNTEAPVASNNAATHTQFDFSRTVHSPPKKAPRASQRKLNFPINCSNVGTCIDNEERGGGDNSAAPNMTKTYRSYHTDLDQDVTLSKMGYILGNIRAKLEASDEHAVRTFQDIERREQQAAGFDCIDSHNNNLRQRTRVDIHDRNARDNNTRRIVDCHDDPIYSEIEEDSIHISGSPYVDNKTGIQHFPALSNPEALYAKVNKIPKAFQPKEVIVTTSMTSAPTPLGKFLHDSLRKLSTAHLKPLPTLQEPSSSDVSEYSSPPPPTPPPNVSSTSAVCTSMLSHCYSLNNIMEQHSPPKQHRNLSKSDLSLHRSEIFLENLCRSEIIVEHGELHQLEKVDNHHLNQSYISLPSRTNDYATTTSTPMQDDDSSVSYELPPHNDADNDSNTAGSHLGLSIIVPPHSHNQSTPKKSMQTQTFMTKQFLDNERTQQQQQMLDIDISSDSIQSPHHLLHNQSSSCPTTPRQLPPIPDVAEQKSHAASLNEVSAYVTANSYSQNDESTNIPLSISTLARYKRIKNALRKSFRKSRNFVKTETKRLSTSLSFPSSQFSTSSNSPPNQSELPASSAASSFNLDTLFALDERAPVTQQLAKAVAICRQLPDLEISPEMVEAERLLLFSTLRRDAKKQKLSLVQTSVGAAKQEPRTRRYFIDAMRLPIKADVSQDIFFNYFYIGTFECDGVISSTQSVECHNREAIFRDCGIEFACGGKEQDLEQADVRCDIFMLRLRKVSTLSLEPRKQIVKIPNLQTPSSTSSSCEEIVSRFRLHASFTLRARDFAPYEYVSTESNNSDKICLRATTSSCRIGITPRTKSTNLANELLLTGRAEVRLSKQKHSGFLNVQDPHSLHNWNRRWCTLDGMQLCVWQDANDMKLQPLLTLDLRDNMQTLPLEVSPRELCARPRVFCLQCATSKAVDSEHDDAKAAVFFSAETQIDLQTWLQQLNDVLNFVGAWLQ